MDQMSKMEASLKLIAGRQAFGVGVMTRFGGATLEEAQQLCKDALTDVLSRKGESTTILHIDWLC